MTRLVDEITSAARRYARNSGLHLPDTDYSRSFITEPASRAIGSAYDALPDFDKTALPAYQAMREETMRQFEHMTKPQSKGGMGLNVEVVREDPYGVGTGGLGAYRGFHDDVRDNRRMKVLSTAATGGHPVFSDDDNDAFRAVHDVFGHLGTGRGVDFSGEEAAYQKHSRMYSPLARQAMATETRGQNAALRMHGEFQDQKVGLLPAHLQGLQFSQVGSAQDVAAAQQRAALKNREQGI